jgi:hypothetical protein
MSVTVCVPALDFAVFCMTVFLGWSHSHLSQSLPPESTTVIETFQVSNGLQPSSVQTSNFRGGALVRDLRQRQVNQRTVLDVWPHVCLDVMRPRARGSPRSCSCLLQAASHTKRCLRVYVMQHVLKHVSVSPKASHPAQVRVASVLSFGHPAGTFAAVKSEQVPVLGQVASFLSCRVFHCPWWQPLSLWHVQLLLPATESLSTKSLQNYFAKRARPWIVCFHVAFTGSLWCLNLTFFCRRSPLSDENVHPCRLQQCEEI